MGPWKENTATATTADVNTAMDCLDTAMAALTDLVNTDQHRTDWTDVKISRREDDNQDWSNGQTIKIETEKLR